MHNKTIFHDHTVLYVVVVVQQQQDGEWKWHGNLVKKIVSVAKYEL